MGDEVQIYLPGPRRWAKGKVVARNVRRMGVDAVSPNMVQLDEGQTVFVPSDVDQAIRTPLGLGETMLQNLRRRASGECCEQPTSTLPGACCDTKKETKFMPR